jgi:recombinational DNA repair ATPase RecF
MLDCLFFEALSYSLSDVTGKQDYRRNQLGSLLFFHDDVFSNSWKKWNSGLRSRQILMKKQGKATHRLSIFFIDSTLDKTKNTEQ